MDNALPWLTVKYSHSHLLSPPTQWYMEEDERARTVGQIIYQLLMQAKQIQLWEIQLDLLSIDINICVLVKVLGKTTTRRNKYLHT